MRPHLEGPCPPYSLYEAHGIFLLDVGTRMSVLPSIQIREARMGLGQTECSEKYQWQQEHRQAHQCYDFYYTDGR
jgi:hypothetical protein